MPEGPEVRKFADSLHLVLAKQRIIQFTARTIKARQWLAENGKLLIGKKVLRVVSHGKHLIGYIENDFYFHSHLMMWGRWQTFVPGPPEEIDRRERARITVKRGSAILYSAPIFNVGHGNPYEQVEYLDSLGPDVLPYRTKFKTAEFRRRLKSKDNRDVTIGAALLDQRVVSGIGNYLRAEILFSCRINPWKLIRQLSPDELTCLEQTIPLIAERAYKLTATASERDRERMQQNPELVYQAGREYGTRHMVFRRTNLPCLRCGELIRQLRQPTNNSVDDDRERIVYFCSTCQDVALEPRKKRARQKKASAAIEEIIERP